MPQPFIYASPEQIMKDKADYARKGIARGKAIVALEYTDGLLFVAENPSATLHKVSELYDDIAFAGVGKYNEYENLRIVGIRQADLTGYQYAREDVSSRSLANLYSQVLGQVFTEALKPFEVEILVAQVGRDGTCEMYHVMYEGTISEEHRHVALGGRAEDLIGYLDEHHPQVSDLDSSLRVAVSALRSAESRDIAAPSIEAAVLDRTLSRRKFRRLEEAVVAAALATDAG